jgi:undecaprenyl diphosphate synthase
MNYQSKQYPRPNNLFVETLPQHIAVIMDGNGRWAKKRGLPRVAGHRQGVKTLKTIVRCCRDWGIGTLTVYAFSTENWKRPIAEVNFLMTLFEKALRQELAELHAEGVKLSFIGDLTVLPDVLKQTIAEATALTANNDAVHLMVAVNYGGRAEITAACQQIAQQVAAGTIDWQNINEQTISQHLMTGTAPDPDLMIRTSRELRLSNFLPWQLAYTEFYFTDSLWPEFGPNELHQALLAYQKRQRRFGELPQSA